MGLKPSHFLKKHVPHLGVAHVFYFIAVFLGHFPVPDENSHILVYQIFITNPYQFSNLFPM